MRWPALERVIEAFRERARSLCAKHEDILAVGYFGSAARGEWGVGSDLDVVVIVKDKSPQLHWEATMALADIPIPVDMIMLSLEEVKGIKGKFLKVLEEETVWVELKDHGLLPFRTG